MPKFTLIEAKAYHCGALVRRLRPEHAQAMRALGYDDMHYHLHAAFVASPAFRYSWLIDGRIAGIGGIVGSAMSATGFVWCAVTGEATRYPLAIVRLCKAALAEAFITRRGLVASTLWGDDASERFAAALGFKLLEDSPQKGVKLWGLGAVAERYAERREAA